jgi:hypothetical protein
MKRYERTFSLLVKIFLWIITVAGALLILLVIIMIFFGPHS